MRERQGREERPGAAPRLGLSLRAQEAELSLPPTCTGYLCVCFFFFLFLWRIGTKSDWLQDLFPPSTSVLATGLLAFAEAPPTPASVMPAQELVLTELCSHQSSGAPQTGIHPFTLLSSTSSVDLSIYFCHNFVEIFTYHFNSCI